MADQPDEPQVDDDGAYLREQDLYLPIANIARIMKKELPANAKIAKDAKETVQECVSEFISFITSECGSLARDLHETPRCSDNCRTSVQRPVGADRCMNADLDLTPPPRLSTQGERQMPAREAQNAQRRRRVVGDDHARLRRVRGAAQGSSAQPSKRARRAHTTL
jgi:histone H3/H4